MKRKWVWMALVAGVAAAAAAAYTPARQFHRFFLTECAADGPAPETELDIDAEPVQLGPFYEALREASGGRFETLTEVVDDAERWPILLLGPSDKRARSMLVVAGVHGNEVSGSLAATAALDLMHGEHTVSVYVIAPANPIGLAHASRYNAQGCDINRDFRAFRTQEARAIRAAIDRLRPDLVVALHEGPQDGVFVIGTGMTPPALLQSMADALRKENMALARENNLGWTLDTPGVMTEGAFITRAKSWLGIYSLGEYTTSLGIPLVTSEVPWNWPGIEERIDAQATVLRVAALHLEESSLESASGAAK